MAVPKIYRLKPVKGRPSRPILPKCLQSKSERRKRCYENWVIAFLILMSMHFVITNYVWLSDEWKAKAGKVLVNRGVVTTHTPVINGSQLPSCVRKKRSGTFAVNTSSIDLTKLDVIYPMVKEGGYHQPPNFSTKDKVAITIPYRRRNRSLSIFLYNIHQFLMPQQIEYRIFIIEQLRLYRFNKGRLYNAYCLSLPGQISSTIDKENGKQKLDTQLLAAVGYPVHKSIGVFTVVPHKRSVSVYSK